MSEIFTPYTREYVLITKKAPGPEIVYTTRAKTGYDWLNSKRCLAVIVQHNAW
jgi:hypothetical protein